MKTAKTRKCSNRRKAAHKHKIMKSKRRNARLLKKKRGGRLTSS